MYGTASNFIKLSGAAHTLSQSFEFEDYYYYCFQLPFIEHPLRCRYYLRFRSLEFSLATQDACRMFIRCAFWRCTGRHLEVEIKEVVWATTAGCPCRDVSDRGKHSFSEGS
jgi:hypothetical protein